MQSLCTCAGRNRAVGAAEPGARGTASCECEHGGEHSAPCLAQCPLLPHHGCSASLQVPGPGRIGTLVMAAPGNIPDCPAQPQGSAPSARCPAEPEHVTRGITTCETPSGVGGVQGACGAELTPAVVLPACIAAGCCMHQTRQVVSDTGSSAAPRLPHPRALRPVPWL